jgi:hypothetical protein
MVDFYATITNDTTQAIYLNGDSYSVSSPLTLDDTPFNNNAPFSLNGGQSSGEIELFDVSLPALTAAGTYGGLFSIVGGYGSSDALVLSNSNFAVTVSGPTQVPEIDPATSLGALALLTGCLAVLRGRRVAETRR